MLCNTTAITLNVKMGFLTLFHGGVGQPLKGPQKPWKLEEHDSFFSNFPRNTCEEVMTVVENEQMI